jgi:hypothetical protein
MRFRHAWLLEVSQPPTAAAVAAFDDAENLAGVGVDHGRHSRLHPPPAVLAAEPARPSVAVLIDPKPADIKIVDVR